MHLHLLTVAFGLTILYPGILAKALPHSSPILSFPSYAAPTKPSTTSPKPSTSVHPTTTPTPTTSTPILTEPTTTTEKVDVIKLIPTTYPTPMMYFHVSNDTKCTKEMPTRYQYDDWLSNICNHFQWWAYKPAIRVVGINETYVKADGFRMWELDGCEGKYDVKPLNNTCTDMSIYKSFMLVTSWPGASLPPPDNRTHILAGAGPAGHIGYSTTGSEVLPVVDDSEEKRSSGDETESLVSKRTPHDHHIDDSSDVGIETNIQTDTGVTPTAFVARIQFYNDHACGSPGPVRDYSDGDMGRCMDMGGAAGLRVQGIAAPLKPNSIRGYRTLDCTGPFMIAPVSGGCLNVLGAGLRGLKIVVD